jgi:hypothetical protein
MKYLKKFENINHYNVGDYVLVNYVTKSTTLSKLANFVNSSIGKIMFIDDKSLIVQYNNIPDKIKHFFSDKTVGNNNIKNSVFFWDKINAIKRLATEEEIEKYKLDTIASKFNI